MNGVNIITENEKRNDKMAKEKANHEMKSEND